MAIELPKGLKPVGDFCIQIVIGAIAFTVVAMVAVLLAALVKWVETWNVAAEWLIGALHWVEWAIFWVDIFCFGLFLIAEVLKLIRALWRDWNEG